MSTRLSWNRKDLIGIEPLSRAEIETIFTAATAFKTAMEADDKKQPYLDGRTVVNLFLEPSTRTRLAFEVAASRLSADTITVTASASSLTKGETLRDTAQNMQALKADVIIMRHAASGAPNYLSKVVDIPVVNAGDGSHAHPTQALLDSFTLLEKLGSLEGKRSPFWVTFCSVAWLVRISSACKSSAQRSPLRAQHSGARRLRVDGRTRLPQPEECLWKMLTPSCCCASSTSAKSSSHFPSIGEYTSMFGLNKDRAHGSSPKQSSCTPAPSTAEWRSTRNSPIRIARSSCNRSPMASSCAWPSSTSATATTRVCRSNCRGG